MKSKILLLMLFCSISSMAQRRELQLVTWQFSQDGYNYSLVNLPDQTGDNDKRCYYKTKIIVPNKYTHAELQFDNPPAKATIHVNDKKMKKGEKGARGYRVDVSSVFGKESKKHKAKDGVIEDGDKAFEPEKTVVVEMSCKGMLKGPVKLVCSGIQGYGTRIDDWSVSARTVSASDSQAVVEVTAIPLNTWGGDSLSFTAYSPEDKVVAHECVSARSNSPSTVMLTIANPQFSMSGKTAVYEVDIALFATEKSQNYDKEEAISRDSFRLPFTISRKE